jgi:hypothetical protein
VTSRLKSGVVMGAIIADPDMASYACISCR